jgi:NAD(P)-dependent dehydrogenase (short-subunit alcohol dehydrogenase family)
MTQALFDLRDTVILITGAGRGIGRESAMLAARAGAKVVASDISLEPLAQLERAVEEEGGELAIVLADVSDESDVVQMIDYAVARYGTVDALVNNVGGTDWVPASFEEATLDYWREILRLNLTSQFMTARAVVPIMRRQGAGKIVNVSSLAGTHGSWRAGAAYSAAKGGVIALTKSLAAALGKNDIVVNAIAQSDTLTERTEELFQSNFWIESKEAMMSRYRRYPLSRPASPLDVARGILFLCSPGADYITGTTLYVDGGARFAWSMRDPEPARMRSS